MVKNQNRFFSVASTSVSALTTKIRPLRLSHINKLAVKILFNSNCNGFFHNFLMVTNNSIDLATKGIERSFDLTKPLNQRRS